MNVICYTDAVDPGPPGQGGRAPRGDRRVGGDRREAGSARASPASSSGRGRTPARSSWSSDIRPTAPPSVAAGSGATRAARRRPGKGRGASAGRFRTSARRSPCSSTPTARTIPEDIPLLVEPILADQADHVTASRLRGGSSELHGGFDEFFRLAGSSFITACINWRFSCRLSDSQNGFRAIRTACSSSSICARTSTTIEQEMIIKTLRRGFRMAEVPSHEHPARARRLAHPRVAQRAALRLLARQVPVLLTGSCPRAMTRERTRHLGRARFGRRAAAGRPASLCRQRRAADPAQARGPLSQPARSRPAWRTPVSRPSTIDRRRGLDVRSRQDARPVVAGKQGALLRRSPPQGQRPVRWPG